MNKKLIAFKMLAIALEEYAVESTSVTENDIINRAMEYGERYKIERTDVESALNTPPREYFNAVCA